MTDANDSKAVDSKAEISDRAQPVHTPGNLRQQFQWFKYAAPHAFFPIAGKLIPWFTGLAILLSVIGLYLGFFVAPPDFQQHDSYRIIFLHVPVSIMSMLVYLVMAFWAAMGLAFNTRLSSMLALSLAPTGALLTFLSLWTGSLWGKPTWGTWWVWDARITSELILLFLYMGFMALHAAIDDVRRADKAAGLLALVGVVNVPIIYFSVQWWNTLHQGSSINTSGSSMAPIMLYPMLIMVFACWAYVIAIALCRLRAIILERERHTDWVNNYLKENA